MSYINVKDIRVGTVIEILQRPIKVREIHISKTGKHGHAKATGHGHGHGYDLFTNKRTDFSFTTHDRIYSNNVYKKTYEFIDIDNDNYMELVDETGNIKNDFQYEGENKYGT